MTQYLLDTNVVIWLSENNPRINGIKDLLFSKNSQIFVSSICWWEIAIKNRAKRYQIDLDNIRHMAEENKFFELPVNNSYIDNYFNLPKIHKDPFDHMLLAQAITSPMRFITGDKILAEYSSLVMVV